MNGTQIFADQRRSFFYKKRLLFNQKGISLFYVKIL